MGSQILFAAGREDMKALNAFVRSLDMYFVPPGPDIEYSDDETILGGCYISLIPKEQLIRDQRYPHRYSSRNPILLFERPVYRPPYLKPGNIYWNNDNTEMAVQTKPVFRKIVGWIRKNWPKPQGFALYAGPQALKLVDQENAIITSLVPDVELIRVPVHSNE